MENHMLQGPIEHIQPKTCKNLLLETMPDEHMKKIFDNLFAKAVHFYENVFIRLKFL